MTYREVARIRRRLEMAGLEISHLDASSLQAVGGNRWSPSWIDADKMAREVRVLHTLGCIRLASLFEAPYVTIGPGGPGALGGMEVFADGLLLALRHAEECGVTLLVEPAPGGLIETTDDFEELSEMIDSPFLGVSLNVGNLFCAGEDPADAIRKLEESLGHICLSDASPSRAPLSLLPGEGAVDFASVAEAAEEIGYDLLFTVLAHQDGYAPDELAARALERLNQLGVHTY